MRNRFCVTDVRNRRIKCVTIGINEDTQSAYGLTVSSCLGHMVTANTSVNDPS